MSLVCGICGEGAPVSPGIVSLAAVGVTWTAMVWLTRRAGMGVALSLLAGLVGLVAAFWGGHLYVVFEGASATALRDTALLLQFWSGGKGVLGAFAGAGAAALALFALWRQPFRPYADTWVPAVALGYVLARLACFLNGDDFGVVSTLPWAVQFPIGTEAYAMHLERGWIPVGASHSLAVHPTQLYHAAVGLFGLMLLWPWRPRWPGQRLALAMAWYGVTRLCIQFLRDDHWRADGPLDPAQWLSLVLVALAIGLWWSGRERGRLVAPPAGVTLR